MRSSLLASAVLLPLALLLTGCADGKITIHNASKSDSVTIRVEVADAPKEREKGLMGRQKLEEDTGMFFAVPEPQILSFWMKNTPQPLEIIFFDAAGGFVNALTMEPCTADPCQIYKSAALAAFALEVNPGFRERHGIGVGATLDIASVRRNVNPR